ncbi:MAG TPA: hypothetical protein EYP56_20925 [Planctomycetaceae bacterium]|nr:hypothetical protein [Planctomycetaceae bacterium]HIQ19973.1 hypothetical protein [Planctomycetota bacterium]
MGRPETPRSSQAGLPRPYDVEMIRDFLDHLLLEVRHQYQEYWQRARDPDSQRQADPQLTRQLATYEQKYASRLVEWHAVDPRGASPEEVRRAVQVLSVRLARRRREQLRHLEALGELFDEALACVLVSRGSSPGKVIRPVSKRRAVKILQADDTR